MYVCVCMCVYVCMYELCTRMYVRKPVVHKPLLTFHKYGYNKYHINPKRPWWRHFCNELSFL